jgi:hypothetical protein
MGKSYALGGRLNTAQITVADDANVIEEHDAAKDQWINKGARRSAAAAWHV